MACTATEMEALTVAFKSHDVAILFCKKLSSHTEQVAKNLADLTYGVNVQFLVWAGALAFIMHAGFAMLCAGSIRSKNTLNILLQTIMDAAVSALAFYVVGYGFAYGYGNEVHESENFQATASGQFIGDNLFGLYRYFKLQGRWELWFFQWAFAATATTIPAGSVAERFNFQAYLGYSGFIAAWVYPVVVHWAWSETGWLGAAKAQGNLFNAGYIDFAGSGVVHMVGGLSGLVGAALVGPRLARFDAGGTPVDMPGHSATLVVLGTTLLWFGWYGFNPGSVLSVTTRQLGTVAARSAVCTTLSGAAGGASALLLSYFMDRAWNLHSLCNGVLVGLVSVTAGAHVLEPWAAVICGLLSCCIFEVACKLLLKMRIDDPLSASAMHGVCGAWGVIFVGLLAKPAYIKEAYNKDLQGNAGLLYGGGGRLLACQVVGVLVISGWVVANMLPFFWLFRYFGKLRISAEEEQAGLDVTTHGSSAYNYDYGLNLSPQLQFPNFMADRVMLAGRMGGNGGKLPGNFGSHGQGSHEPSMFGVRTSRSIAMDTVAMTIIGSPNTTWERSIGRSLTNAPSGSDTEGWGANALAFPIQADAMLERSIGHGITKEKSGHEMNSWTTNSLAYAVQSAPHAGRASEDTAEGSAAHDLMAAGGSGEGDGGRVHGASSITSSVRAVASSKAGSVFEMETGLIGSPPMRGVGMDVATASSGLAFSAAPGDSLEMHLLPPLDAAADAAADSLVSAQQSPAVGPPGIPAVPAADLHMPGQPTAADGVADTTAVDAADTDISAQQTAADGVANASAAAAADLDIPGQPNAAHGVADATAVAAADLDIPGQPNAADGAMDTTAVAAADTDISGQTSGRGASATSAVAAADLGVNGSCALIGSKAIDAGELDMSAQPTAAGGVMDTAADTTGHSPGQPATAGSPVGTAPVAVVDLDNSGHPTAAGAVMDATADTAKQPVDGGHVQAGLADAISKHEPSAVSTTLGAAGSTARAIITSGMSSQVAGQAPPAAIPNADSPVLDDAQTVPEGTGGAVGGDVQHAVRGHDVIRDDERGQHAAPTSEHLA